MHRTSAVTAVVLLPLLAGCLVTEPSQGPESYRALGFDGTRWPSLNGTKVTILAYSSYASAFAEHEKLFETLTGADAVLLTVDDAGRVLERAIAEKGNPTFDVIYGIDNVLLGKATSEGIYRDYDPLLASRIRADLRIAGPQATPVNHGYVAVNVDPRANLTVPDLSGLKMHAGRFVTPDPRTSTPGLGFLIATVATFGEKDPAREDYIDYWSALFAGGVTVTTGWDDAYVNRFSGGYGQFEEGTKQDKAIVTSYTTSPAYEMFWGYDQRNEAVLAPNATFHQIQTMGIAQGARNGAGAEAWIEFCLTDAFQATAARLEAVYPAVSSANATDETTKVYQGRDPAPGTFAPAPFTVAQLDASVERWLREWTDAYEASRSA